MIARARLISVVAILAAGAVGVVSSTQTWFTVVLADGAQDELVVPGAAAVPVLAPLSLAVLALGLALAVAGSVLRYVFGVLALAIGGILVWLTAAAAFAPSTAHVASTVTAATGITGETSVAELIESVEPSAWPFVTLAAWIVLLIAGTLTLATAHRWRAGGRKYRTDAAPAAVAGQTGSRPHDAIDDWDDLSRGEDPTSRPLD